MILNFWNNLKGFLLIEVSGFSIERFMNLAVNKNIYLWDIDYQSNKILMKVSIKGYKELKYCAKKTKCKIKIKNKYGLPFVTFKYRKRKVLLIGFISFILLLYFLSTFIWAIQVTGNNKVETYKILDFLEEKNITIGTKKSNINTILLEEEFLKEFEEISWVNIQSKGTTLNINTAEILDDKEVIKEKEPSNIVASKDALITYIAVNNGLASAKAYDVVKEGDILITGEIFLKEDENGKTYRYTYAEGVVKGKLYYDMSFFVPYQYDEYEYTENTKKRYSIYFGKHKINLYFNSNFYDNYDIMVENKQLSLGENYPTPIVLKKNLVKEKTVTTKVRTIDESKEYANNLINEKIITEFDISVDIVDKKIEYIEKDNGLEIKVTLTTIEDIGVVQNIIFNDEKVGNMDNE